MGTVNDIPTSAANPVPVALTGGATAEDASPVPNPTMTGGKAASSNPAAGTTGRLKSFLCTLLGVQVVKPFSIPESDWLYQNLNTVNTDIAAAAARGAGVRNYVTAVQLQNTSATPTVFSIKDGATNIWQISLPASMVTAIVADFPTPLRGSANTILNVNSSAAANVYVNAQGYFAP